MLNDIRSNYHSLRWPRCATTIWWKFSVGRLLAVLTKMEPRHHVVLLISRLSSDRRHNLLTCYSQKASQLYKLRQTFMRENTLRARTSNLFSHRWASIKASSLIPNGYESVTSPFWMMDTALAFTEKNLIPAKLSRILSHFPFLERSKYRWWNILSHIVPLLKSNGTLSCAIVRRKGVVFHVQSWEKKSYIP